MVFVKICGLTSVEDAHMAVDAGADAVGLNFFPGSVRCIDAIRARAIVDAVGARALVVAVVVDMAEGEVRALQQQVGFRCVQFHGDESPELVQAFLPHAYKALRVQGPESLAEIDRYPGDHVLLDAYVKGLPGGTGATFDWSIAAAVAQRRQVTLAGGLVPDNVADAVRAVRPYCVDVASGVESAPGIKDQAKVTRFIRAAREA